MVESYWDQESVEEAIDASSDCSEAHDSLTESYECAIDEWPYEDHRDTDRKRDERSHDSNRALAREESKEFRKLRSTESVIGESSDKTCKDTDELVVDFCESRCVQSSDIPDKLWCYSAKDLLEYKPGYKTCKGRCPILILGHSYCDADGEENRHVVDKRTASFDKNECDIAVCTPARRVNPVADTHQNASNRQTCYRKHERLTESL